MRIETEGDSVRLFGLDCGVVEIETAYNLGRLWVEVGRPTNERGLQISLRPTAIGFSVEIGPFAPATDITDCRVSAKAGATRGLTVDVVSDSGTPVSWRYVGGWFPYEGRAMTK